MKRVRIGSNNFVLMDSKVVKDSRKGKAKGSRKKIVARKRTSEKPDNENVKRQKIEDDAEKEDLRACLDILPGMASMDANNRHQQLASQLEERQASSRMMDSLVCNVGVATVVHLYVFPAVPYKCGERCVRDISVMTDYAALGAPPNAKEVRECEKTPTGRNGCLNDRPKHPKTKKYSELSATEAIQADCDIKATNIILQGLPPEVYALVSNHKVAKELWERIQLLMQGTLLTKQERECKLYDEFDKFAYKKGETLCDFYLRFSLLLNDMNIYNMKLEQFQVNIKFLNTLPPEWSKFMTDVKLVQDLHTTNIDQLHAYLDANEVRLMHERNSDPLALYGSPYQSQQYSNNKSSTPLLITYPSNNYQSSVHHNVYSPSSSIPQIEYAPTVNQQQQPEFPQLDLNLIVPVFKQEEPKKVSQALAMKLGCTMQGKTTSIQATRGMGVMLPTRRQEGEEQKVFRNKKMNGCPRIEAIRLFLAFASFMGFIVYQMDVKSAFLYGNITEEVYVKQPPGFEDPAHPNKVYRVVKALYGLHQAPRAWYERLSTFLLKHGYRRGAIDKTLFIKKDRRDIMLVQVYVDDIIFGSTKSSMVKDFEDLMQKEFKMSSMGELTFFLGLQVKQTSTGIFLSQDKYVKDILNKFDFRTIKPASTPIEAHKSLGKDEEGEDVDVHLYRSMIGCLMYLTASRPDIMFAVCLCARFQVTPKVSHLHE
ncbi:putative ribonuclease H-like domain-containing protein [Tanacetum coccineum]